MFSDTITYKDFDGNERTETLYFNISPSEAMELEIKYPGGYANKLQRDIDRGDNAAIMQDMIDFVKLSYGIKSDDGRKFVKSVDIYEDFVSTNAYEEFLQKFLADPDYALKFIVAAFPKNGVDMSEEELMAKVKKNTEKKLSASSESVIEAVVEG